MHTLEDQFIWGWRRSSGFLYAIDSTLGAVAWHDCPNMKHSQQQQNEHER